MATKTVAHPASTTVQLAGKSSVTQTVTITPIITGERVWVSTNPLVSIYPWYGQSVVVGVASTFGVNPGQTLYSYTIQPAQLSVTIA
jgi:hypothetical protein